MGDARLMLSPDPEGPVYDVTEVFRCKVRQFVFWGCMCVGAVCGGGASQAFEGVRLRGWLWLRLAGRLAAVLRWLAAVCRCNDCCCH
jgi:hypothetical protein